MGEDLDARLVSYSLKIVNRNRTIYFFRNVLGMKIVRHKEYSELNHSRKDVKIQGRWSSTVVSYGNEDNFFNLELIYNYGVRYYNSGNAFRGITIRCNKCLRRASNLGWPVLPGNVLKSPGGYLFYVIDEPQPIKADPIVKISFAVSNIRESRNFYSGMIGFHLHGICLTNAYGAILGLKNHEPKLELQKTFEPINNGENDGMLGIGLEYGAQLALREKLAVQGKKIVVPLMPVESPGQPTMAMFCIEDPDGHQVNLYELSPYRCIMQQSPHDEIALAKRIEDDESPLPHPSMNKSKKRSPPGKDTFSNDFKMRMFKGKPTRSLASIEHLMKRREPKKRSKSKRIAKNPSKNSETASTGTTTGSSSSKMGLIKPLKEISEKVDDPVLSKPQHREDHSLHESKQVPSKHHRSTIFYCLVMSLLSMINIVFVRYNPFIIELQKIYRKTNKAHRK